MRQNPLQTGPVTREQSFVPNGNTGDEFRRSLGRFATGVTVVTTATGNGPLGMTANSFTSVSLDPPLILWSVAKTSSRYVFFSEATHFAVHVLAKEEAAIAVRFAKSGSAFEGISWIGNEEGVPIINGTLARFECSIAARHDAGDHTILIGHVLRAAHREGDPLCFSQGVFGGFTSSLE
ncbi:flavin reductase family protein [Oryzifoliimicrobium ureilyticus]|uniref:flavin reductase family protein n=1 Tax=Oryzifoliimicrobium ureilyticus TaxID=3113724 RepID=UPI00307619AB